MNRAPQSVQNTYRRKNGSGKQAQRPLQSAREAAIEMALVQSLAAQTLRVTRDGPTTVMTEQELQKRLEFLKSEHRDLDAAIAALVDAGASDQLQIARLKKRKLRLKDQIAIIEDTLLPDIIA